MNTPLLEMTQGHWIAVGSCLFVVVIFIYGAFCASAIEEAESCSEDNDEW